MIFTILLLYAQAQIAELSARSENLWTLKESLSDRVDDKWAWGEIEVS